MENQHRIITGYRDLSAEEIALMNEIKQHGYALEALIAKVDRHVGKQFEATHPRFGEPSDDDPLGEKLLDTHEQVSAKRAEAERLCAASPARWASIGKTHMQEGLMALTRAVAQPGSF